MRCTTVYSYWPVCETQLLSLRGFVYWNLYACAKGTIEMTKLISKDKHAVKGVTLT